jgi:hypothetical protein
MNATGIIYPWFWILPEVEHIFLAQLNILKAHYCHGKNIGANQMYIPLLLDELNLKAQASLFKMTMLANFIVAMKLPLDYNPCSKMWALLTTNQIICSKLSKWLKLVELSMVMVFGNVEDDMCFFHMSFMKSKLRN